MDVRQKTIRCQLCGEAIDVGVDLQDGQHVRCPFCQGKFSYRVESEPQGEILETDLRRAIAECRKDPEKNRYYSKAPAGAKLYIGLIFYGEVFGSKVDVEKYMAAFTEIEPELKECDLDYLIENENDERLVNYFNGLKSALSGQPVSEHKGVQVLPKVGVLGAERKHPNDFHVYYRDVPSRVETNVPLLSPEDENAARKKKANRIVSRFQEKMKDHEWIRSTITRILVVVGAFVFAVVLGVLYVRYHVEIDTRIELRNTLAEFIRSNHQMLKDRYSQYSLAIRNCRNDMWNSRGDHEEMRLLKGRLNSLLSVQSAIDDVDRVFASVAPRLDAMDVNEIKKTQDDLSNRIFMISKRFENKEVDPLASLNAPERGGAAAALPKRPIDVLNAPSVPRADECLEKDQSVDSATRLQSRIRQGVVGVDISAEKLGDVGIDADQLNALDAEAKKIIMTEAQHDIEMKKRKELSSVRSESVQPKSTKGVGAIEPHYSGPCAVAEDRPLMTTGSSKMNATEEKAKPAENAKLSITGKPQPRKCYKCFGKGTLCMTVNKDCEDCEGRGFIVKEVTIKDTKYSTDGRWNYKHDGTRTSTNRQYCEQCKRRGKITVKRDVTCTVCNGSGYLLNGMSYNKLAKAKSSDAEEVAQWLIPTAEKGGAIWRYNRSVPEASWFKFDYDHSKWLDGRSAFARRDANLNVGTEWNEPDIYLRRKFNFDGDPSRIKTAKLRYSIDDSLQVWLNGEKLCERSGVDERYREIDITETSVRLLRKGDNVIAVWAHDYYDRRNVDVGIFVIYQ